MKFIRSLLLVATTVVSAQHTPNLKGSQRHRFLASNNDVCECYNGKADCMWVEDDGDNPAPLDAVMVMSTSGWDFETQSGSWNAYDDDYKLIYTFDDSSQCVGNADNLEMAPTVAKAFIHLEVLCDTVVKMQVDGEVGMVPGGINDVLDLYVNEQWEFQAGGTKKNNCGKTNYQINKEYGSNGKGLLLLKGHHQILLQISLFPGSYHDGMFYDITFSAVKPDGTYTYDLVREPLAYSKEKGYYLSRGTQA